MTLDASLRQPCPPLQRLDDARGDTVLRWGIDTAKAYRVCAARMDALIDATQPWAGPAGVLPPVDYSLSPAKK